MPILIKVQIHWSKKSKFWSCSVFSTNNLYLSFLMICRFKNCPFSLETTNNFTFIFSFPYLMSFTTFLQVSFPFLAFETVEEFLAVTSSLSVDVWTSGRPSTWADGVWEFNGQVVSDMSEMWDPCPPPEGNILFHRAVFSASTRKLFSVTILSSYTALCEQNS